jgi:hypothetical protein
MYKKNFEYQIKQLKITYSKEGFKKLILNFFYILLNKFMPIGFTYKLDLDKLEYTPSPKGFTFKAMTTNDLKSIFHDYKDEIDENIHKDLLKKLNDPAYSGFIIKKEDKICGYCFLNYGTTYPILKNKFLDEKNNGHILNDYVFKNYRGQRIQQYAFYKRIQNLKQKNYKTATALIAIQNYPSRRSVEKMGFKKCVLCYHFRFGKWIRSRNLFKIIGKN